MGSGTSQEEPTALPGSGQLAGPNTAPSTASLTGSASEPTFHSSDARLKQHPRAWVHGRLVSLAQPWWSEALEKLNLSMEVISGKPPSKEEFDFDLDLHLLDATQILKRQPSLQRCRFKLVPARMKDEDFWRNVFYQLYMYNARKLAQGSGTGPFYPRSAGPSSASHTITTPSGPFVFAGSRSKRATHHTHHAHHRHANGTGAAVGRVAAHSGNAMAMLAVPGPRSKQLNMNADLGQVGLELGADDITLTVSPRTLAALPSPARSGTVDGPPLLELGADPAFSGMGAVLSGAEQLQVLTEEVEFLRSAISALREDLKRKDRLLASAGVVDSPGTPSSDATGGGKHAGGSPAAAKNPVDSPVANGVHANHHDAAVETKQARPAASSGVCSHCGRGNADAAGGDGGDKAGGAGGTHTGEWEVEKTAREFLELDDELKQNLRSEKQKRIKEAVAQLNFILDTDDPAQAPGKWTCCGSAEYQSDPCS